MNKYDSNMIPFSEASFRYNDFLLDYCQTTTPALSGCAAGNIGLTSD